MRGLGIGETARFGHVRIPLIVTDDSADRDRCV